MTYPNQRTVKIHREKPKSDFLGIKNENWKAASRNLSAHSFLLYIYLASNADNYSLALSPAAVRQEIGMARSTYHDQFHILVDKGYLVPTHGNTYEFFEVPRTSRGEDKEEESTMLADGIDFAACTDDGNALPQIDKIELSEDIEINNSQENINKGINNEQTQQDEQQPMTTVKEITIPSPRARPSKKFRF
ncbi:MAG: hypothetical protein J6A16_10335 [Oscillospiraceae bacterium]|nr:hypothetical protein [Oscillospiraceae bacterium]